MTGLRSAPVSVPRPLWTGRSQKGTRVCPGCLGGGLVRAPHYLVAVAVVAAVSLPSAAAAQKGLSVGARLGLSSAGVYGEDAEEVDARYGFTGGLSAALGLSRRLALELDVAYADKGGEMKGSFGTLGYHFRYVEVPVLLRYNVLPEGGLAPALVVGVAPAFRLNSTTTSWSGPGPAPPQFVFPKPVDLGVLLGTTVGTRAGRHAVRFEARYTLGLTKFADLQFTGTETAKDPDVDLKNRAWTVTVGYAFNIAPKLFASAP